MGIRIRRQPIGGIDIGRKTPVFVDGMLNAGAKSVRAVASHCVMSDPASDRVQNSALKEIVFTDSIPYSQKCAKVKQISIADMFATAIRCVQCNESVSESLNF